MMNDISTPTYKLPPKAYFDETWFADEQQKLFGNSWLFAGLESEVASPGSFKTVQAGLAALVIVRDKQGNLNAFHNACRHRGAQLVQGSGQCGTMVCPYHKWTYGLDGKLRGIAMREQYGPLDMTSLGLHIARVESWMGLLFIHPDETPAISLSDWLGTIKTELEVFRTSELQLLKQHSFTFDANWKLYIENHIDWLHLWFIHPETLGAFDHSSGNTHQHGLNWTSYEPVKDEFKQVSEDRSPLIDIPHLASEADRYSEVGAHFIFPNLPVFTGKGFFATADLIPLSPTKTQMNISLLGIEGGDVDSFMAVFNKITKDEDVGIIENIQKNISSSRFSVGPISHTYEKPIADFHDNYLVMMA